MRKSLFFIILALCTLVLSGCSIAKEVSADSFVSPVESKDNYTENANKTDLLMAYEVNDNTGAVVEDSLLTLDEYLKIVDDIYFGNQASENGFYFENTIGTVKLGLNKDYKLVFIDPDTNEEIVFINDTLTSLFVEDTDIYFTDISNVFRCFHLDTGDIETVVEDVTYPVIHNHNVYYLDRDNVFLVNGL